MQAALVAPQIALRAQRHAGMAGPGGPRRGEARLDRAGDEIAKALHGENGVIGDGKDVRDPFAARRPRRRAHWAHPPPGPP